MTRRHIFSSGLGGLCNENFGGVAFCNLPAASEWHFSDKLHPFTNYPDYPEECGWVTSEGRCCADAGDPVHRPEWKDGHVYPPSDDAGAPTEVLELKLEPVNPEPPQPEWSRAVDALNSPDQELLSGPWPVAKFRMFDDDTAFSPLYLACMNALRILGADYCVSVYRPRGTTWRFALVTWDWALGLSMEDLCDEIASYFG